MSTSPAGAPEPSATLFSHLEIPEMAARIMQAAMNLFARKGYSATSVREIVQEAHVTNPMLYYYFDSKEGLFQRLLEVLNTSIEHEVIAVLELDAGLEEKVRRIWHLHMQAAKESPEALRFIYSVLFGPSESRPPHDMFVRRAALMMRVHQMFADAIESGELAAREGVTPQFLMMRLFGGINQHLMVSLKISETDPEGALLGTSLEAMFAPTMADELVDFFFQGAGLLRVEEEAKVEVKER